MTATADRRAKPHHVYLHLNGAGDVVYVGRTVDPATRPFDSKDRPWVATIANVEVSPAMPYTAAAWMESSLIRAIRPEHNQINGSERVADDWRVDYLMDAEGVDRPTATWGVRYMPTDPDDFRAAVAHRVALGSALERIARPAVVGMVRSRNRKRRTA